MSIGAGITQDNYISVLVADSDLFIKQILSELDDDLQKVLWGFMDRGKRLRPFILACVSRMLNGDREIALKLAASVEIYHNSTLIFDDIQDNSLLRRGRPTLFAQFGPGMSISYASVLRSMMTKTFANQLPVEDSLLVYQWIYKVAAMLSLGQYREMSWSYFNNLNISENDYLEMAKYKTGALLGLSALFGGISAKCKKIDELFEFGCNLGIAYQIYDDIGNVDEKQNQNKDKYSDITSKKVTLLTVHSIEHNNVNLKDELINIFSGNNLNESDVKRVLQIFKDSNALEYSYEIANTYLQNAISILRQIPDSDSVFREKFINQIKEIFRNA